MPNLRVCKSNALVEAAYRLTLGEHRVILACIAQVRRDTPISDQILYEVRAMEIAERSGIARQTAYEELEKAAQTLFERYVAVPYSPDGGSPAKRKFRWVQLVDYVPAEGLIRLQFTTAILPYLADLSERYTIYSIADVAKMTSAYGVRLYELLVQWRGVGCQREVELDWLRQVFQLEDRYPSIKDLKKWVIEPAVEQVNEHSPLQVTWEQRKSGRKVTHLIFSFAPKEAAKASARAKPMADIDTPRIVTDAELSRLAYPGESREAALRRLNAALG